MTAPLPARAAVAFLIALTLVGVGPVAAQTSLDALLESFAGKYDLPALAAAVVSEGKVVALGAVGVRKAGTGIRVTRDDRFHLGSDTKAFTALLAAMLVEEGKLRSTTTMADVFPELAGTMDAVLKHVTVEQLLSHTGGTTADGDPVWDVLGRSLLEEGNLDDTRYWVVQQLAPKPLPSAAGAGFTYSNVGYVMAGAIERVARRPWEELITERIFVPLGLRTAGLGAPASLGKTDAPLGHMELDGKRKAFPAGPNGDIPAVIGPAGNAHMLVGDFARWAAWNAGEGKRGPALVKPETFRKLHAMVVSMPEKKDAAPGTPSGGRYALGWGELTVPWAPYPLMYHGGSNGKNLAHVWVDPRRDFAMVVMTNTGGERANTAFFALAPALYEKFATSRAPAPPRR